MTSNPNNQNIKCAKISSTNSFCVGFQPDNKVYCYGDDNGCKTNDCVSDQDCKDKYNTITSSKYDDTTKSDPKCDGTDPTNNWKRYACPNPYRLKCSSDKSCVGFESNHEVYCYGSKTGCLSDQCTTDANCTSVVRENKYSLGVFDCNAPNNIVDPSDKRLYACPDPYQVNNMDVDELDNIYSKNETIIKKERIQQQLLKEIESKEKLLLTRSRMLQISQDRNSYKKLLIYYFTASAFMLSIIILFIYYIVRKKKV